MPKYANQRTIWSRKPDYKKSPDTFYQLHKDPVHLAFKNLTYSEFKVWTYLMGIQSVPTGQSESWDWSPAHASEVLSLSPSTVSEAFSALIRKGYLFGDEEHLDKNGKIYIFNFFELPMEYDNNGKLVVKGSKEPAPGRERNTAGLDSFVF